MSKPFIEKVLSLSTAHMPSTNPDFSGLRYVKHKTGYIAFVAEYPVVPDWLTPVISLAYRNNCTLILFDRDIAEDEDLLPVWDW
jgi:hypothetical protein